MSIESVGYTTRYVVLQNYRKRQVHPRICLFLCPKCTLIPFFLLKMYESCASIPFLPLVGLSNLSSFSLICPPFFPPCFHPKKQGSALLLQGFSYHSPATICFSIIKYRKNPGQNPNRFALGQNPAHRHGSPFGSVSAPQTPLLAP